MVVGVLQIDLRLHAPQNLKQKRGVIQKILARCRNHFPASCAEIGHQDLWQRSLLGFAVINTSEQVVAPILTRIENEILDNGEVDLINADTEFIHYWKEASPIVASQRAQRVAETIHKEISNLLIKGLKDPRIGFVTITSVDVTPDLRQARVYFTLMGSQDDRQQSQSGLDSSSSYVRQQLGKVLRLRHIPEINFIYDASVDYGQHIEKLLSEVKSDLQEDD